MDISKYNLFKNVLQGFNQNCGLHQVFCLSSFYYLHFTIEHFSWDCFNQYIYFILPNILFILPDEDHRLGQ